MTEPGADHYFTARPSAPSDARTVTLALPEFRLTLQTDRGVFSADGVDPGTRLLLLEAPPPPDTADAQLVDVGCGYGPIAIALARRAPQAHVWAVDVNERARALTSQNAAAAGVTNLTVAAPEEIPEDLVVDRIYANPPIRVGKRALHELLDHWLARLAPDGAAYLVVHKHLGADSLQARLVAQGWAVERLCSRIGYRILAVRRAAAPTVEEAP